MFIPLLEKLLGQSYRKGENFEHLCYLRDKLMQYLSSCDEDVIRSAWEYVYDAGLISRNKYEMASLVWMRRSLRGLVDRQGRKKNGNKTLRDLEYFLFSGYGEHKEVGYE